MPVAQRVISIKQKDEEPIITDEKGALQLLKVYYPDLFEKELIDHDEDYIILLQLMSEGNSEFSSFEELGNALEIERRRQISSYGKKEPKDKEDMKEKLKLDDVDMKEKKELSFEKVNDEIISSGILDSIEEEQEYDEEAILQYRLSMAYGRAWGSEAEATVVADSLGVRFRIYTFDNHSTVPTSNIIVGAGGPIYALHYDPSPGHYSLLEPDPGGLYHLHGTRYKFVKIPKDGHCLFGAGFRAVTGRAATPNDIYNLRAVAASMVPDEIVQQMIITLGYGLKKSEKPKEKKEEVKEDFSDSDEIMKEKDVKDKDVQEKGVKELKPFMSRINYLLNRYPNLFYPLRSQHTDFGKMIGSFSETRQMFFYNDMLVPKVPMETEKSEKDSDDELSDEDIVMDKTQSKDDKPVKAPDLPLKLSILEDKSGVPDILAMRNALKKMSEQMQLFISETEKSMKRMQQKDIENEEEEEDDDDDETDNPVLYELLTPEQFEHYELAIREGLKHHNLKDEMDLGKIELKKPHYFEKEDEDDEIDSDKKEKDKDDKDDIDFSIPLLQEEDVDTAKEFAKRYQYSSNDPEKRSYHLPHIREKQESEMRELRKDKALVHLRKNKLKFSNKDHAEQLLVSGRPWEAITTVALDEAFREATTETLSDEEIMIDLSDKKKIDIKKIKSPHVFTVVINRASCPSCTDALISAIRLFWRTCAKVFELDEKTARESLGHIFQFELSVTGMYSAKNDDSTTENDLKALQLSGWQVGLHHDKSGGLAPQGYSFVEALYGKHDKEKIDKMAGKGQPSVKSISMEDKLELGKVRKYKALDVISRGPKNRDEDVKRLTEMLDPKKSIRTIIQRGKEFIGHAIDEISNYTYLDSENYETQATEIFETMMSSQLFTEIKRGGNEKTTADIIKELLKCLNDIYDLLDKMRTDKE